LWAEVAVSLYREQEAALPALHQPVKVAELKKLKSGS